MAAINSSDLKKINDTLNGRTVVIVLKSTASFNDEVLKKINVKKLNCIYISLNDVYPKIKLILQKDKIDVSMFYFIDATGTAESNRVVDDQCTYVQGPEALTQLSIAIDSALETGAFNLIVINSVSTLLMYNNQETTEKFARFIINKLKNYGAGGLVLFLDDEKSQKAARIISQFCDDQMIIA